VSIPAQPFQTLEAEADADDRLDRFLARRFPDVSRARFQKLIADGLVSVEGQPVTEARHKVQAGTVITATLPAAVSADPLPEAIPLQVVYEDADLIVIDKPAGLVVHPGAGNETGTLVNALIAHCGASLSGIGGVRRPGIVHRLDKDTSGLLVVAKNDKAHHGLSQQFAAHGRDGRLVRAYLALAWGGFERPRGTVATGIARSNANRQKMAVSRADDAREAITHFEVLEAFGGKIPIASLIRCNLETGRTHQIRVHMAHLGHPLLGDGVYGSAFKTAAVKLPAAAQQALKLLNRQALHAAVLGFDHPRTGRPLHFESAPPHDLEKLITALRAPSS
jgi:23S rRNA pseudouridine1911/1915/1917 synthase